METNSAEIFRCDGKVLDSKLSLRFIATGSVTNHATYDYQECTDVMASLLMMLHLAVNTSSTMMYSLFAVLMMKCAKLDCAVSI